jgi:hypothetical protein
MVRRLIILSTVFLGMSTGVRTAFAQACCAGGGAYQPARLKLHEDYLVGIQARAQDELGSLDPVGQYNSNPAGTAELDLEQDLVGTLRLLERGQVGVSVPLVETHRTVPGLSEWGGGLGDIALSLRYDFLYAAESAHLPGLAVVGGVTFPTGRAPEQAHSTLGTDATGTGSFQGSAGLEIEQVFGHLVLSLTAQAWASAPRTVASVHSQLGPQISGLAAVGWIFGSDAAVALAFSTSQSWGTRINGVVVANSGQGLTTAELSGGLPINDAWRLQGGLLADLPVLGRNRPTGVGVSFSLLRTWT